MNNVQCLFESIVYIIFDEGSFIFVMSLAIWLTIFSILMMKFNVQRFEQINYLVILFSIGIDTEQANQMGFFIYKHLDVK